jgi:glycosyltransferase involved in cell wall biosynthesis
VTYVARNLEPYRGFPALMRALPAILEARPHCEVVIVGGDGVSYGSTPQGGQSWREQLLAEVKPDLRRVHFVGRIPYSQFLPLLQISSAHVYLTVPFVLSWSLLEALAAGCIVVGSATGPVMEVIDHGRNGFLADLLSPPAIAAQVIEVLRQRSALASLAVAARHTVLERYDLQRHCLPQQLQLIHRLAESGYSGQRRRLAHVTGYPATISQQRAVDAGR